MSGERDRQAALAPDDRVGTQFGGYRIEELIGVGGMGRVYRATGEDGVAVALKLVKEDLARDETFRRRFRREARIAQTVQNPHVVPVHHAGELDGIPYLAAQYVDGTVLDRKLRDGGALDLADDDPHLRGGRGRSGGPAPSGHGPPGREAGEHPA